MQICGICGLRADGDTFSKHRCREVVKQLRLDLAEKDSWIKALETRIDTMTGMLKDAGVVGTEIEERDQT